MKNIKEKLNKYFKKLFDFSFKETLTMSVIRVLYWINVVIGGVLASLTVMAGFNQSVFLGVLALVFSPLVFGVYLIVLRVLLEAVAVVFNIAENVKKITETVNIESKRIKVEEYEVKDKEDK